MQVSFKILLNTIALYGKVVLTAIINLYLTRAVLHELGVNDFGIYNLIAGVVSILSFLNGALMASTQRDLSVAIGTKNSGTINRVFSSSLLIHIVLAIILFFFIEICGIFMFDGFLNIEESRIDVAKTVYHLMAFSVAITILGVPYNAAINSHEDMWYFAIVETTASLLKLGVIIGFALIETDALILYTSWVVGVTAFSILVKYIWCKFKYSETRNINLSYKGNKSSVKHLSAFIGWNSLGSLAVVGRNQGIAIILNVFFSTAINAVYGIANQVSGQLAYFSQMMTTTMAPQIMKSKGEGDIERMIYLACLTSKLSYFLSAILAIPLLLEIDFILTFWLGTAPEYTTIYCCCTILIFLIMQLYPGLNRAILADGRIKNFQIYTSILLLAPIIAGAIMFKYGAIHYSIMFIMIVAQVMMLLMTMMIAHKLFGLSLKKYCDFLIRALFVFAILYLCGLMIQKVCSDISANIRFLSVVIITTLLFPAFFYTVILSSREQVIIKNIVVKIKQHIS